MTAADLLKIIAQSVSSCTKCSLCRTRNHAVPGNGSGSAKILFVGEAPGRSEDLRARPFAGSAGKRLDEALKAAGLDRESVYVTNVVKCRPPKNRVPTQAERDACMPYLKEEIASLRPAAVCVMGNTAMQSLLGMGNVTKNRGLVGEFGSVKYYATVHPAATIYNRKLFPVLKADIAALAANVAARALPRSFYRRDTVTVARQLLGKKLVRRIGGKIMSGIITETEAYKHTDDGASHAYGGMTERNSAMFGECGRAYVYFTYGMYHCFNVVARSKASKAGAVLIRAIEPLEGVERMIKNRKSARAKAGAAESRINAISDGPAKLAQAMCLTKSQYGADLTESGPVYIAEGADVRKIRACARIGVGRGTEKMWNFTCDLPRPQAPRVPRAR